MRKKSWIVFVWLGALVCSVSVPAPALADGDSVGDEPQMLLGQVMDGYHAFVDWVVALSSLNGKNELPDFGIFVSHLEGDSPDDALAGPTSTSCELSSCGESGADFDPNG
ncbi:MAG: hypothetical protein ACLF0P_00345 [Thermoanaerobaculia bacterium]